MDHSPEGLWGLRDGEWRQYRKANGTVWRFNRACATARFRRRSQAGIFKSNRSGGRPGGPPQVVFQPSRGAFGPGVAFNKTGTYAGLTLQTPDEPVEAYVMQVASMKPVRVSAANVDLPKQGLGETRVIQWKSKDGKEVEGLLTLPVNYDKSKRYPLILNIHGGPAGAFSETFIGASGLYPIASFAARGWAVLRANPRGSTSYGLPFRAANFNDWGGGDYQDLMSGVDQVIAMGVAGPNKLAVMGWSYGGYMTNWVVTQTNRFKCAATGA